MACVESIHQLVSRALRLVPGRKTQRRSKESCKQARYGARGKYERAWVLLPEALAIQCLRSIVIPPYAHA